MKLWLGTALAAHAGVVIALGQGGTSSSLAMAAQGPSQVDIEVLAPAAPPLPDPAPAVDQPRPSRIQATRAIPAPPPDVPISTSTPSTGELSDTTPDPTPTAAPPHFTLALNASIGSGHGPQQVEATATPSTVSTPARLVSSLAPSYPAGARDDGVEADVRIEIVVDGSGQVVEARPLQRAGSGFDEAALSAIASYRFSPAMKDGKVVRVRMPWTVEFRLR